MAKDLLREVGRTGGNGVKVLTLTKPQRGFPKNYFDLPLS